MKRTILIVIILCLFSVPLSAAEKQRPPGFDQGLKGWLGKKVNVDYDACSPTGCVMVRNAVLTEVTRDAIIVIVNGSPFLIPKYIVTRVELSK
jgi:hypothetical protein